MSAPAHRRQQPSRIVLVVAGLAALLALAAFTAGGTLIWLHTTQRDAEGFYVSSTKTLSTSTHAIVSNELEVGTDGPNWLLRRGRLGTIRVSATGTGAKPIFVGIASKTEIRAYLNGVARDEVTDLDVAPFTVTYDRRPGSAIPAAPTTQSFWSKAVHGSGRQTLTWPVREGAWDVVLMNADGTAAVRTDVTLSARAPIVIWLGIGLVAAGAILVAAGGGTILFGTRESRRRHPADDRADPAPATADPVLTRSPG